MIILTNEACSAKLVMIGSYKTQVQAQVIVLPIPKVSQTLVKANLSLKISVEA